MSKTLRPPTNHPRHRWFQFLVGLALAAMVFASCAAADDEATSVEDGGFDSADDAEMADADDMAEEADMAEEEADVATADAANSGDAAPDEALAQNTALTAADLGRDIIFRADIAVEVADVAAAGREATQRIEALGGIVFGQTTVVEPEPRTVLTFKIQPADFDTALDQLSGVGALVDQTISADDVTARVVDLESRVLTAETSVGRLREFLAGAQTVEDVASLEAELVERELELESLRGQLRTIRDQVALATITMVITEQGADTAAVAFEVLTGIGADEDEACPGAVEFEVGRNGTIVWCVEIENQGDATLGDIELTSPGLGLRTRDFEWLDGPSTTIEPGEIARAVIELEVEDSRIRRRDAQGGLRLEVFVDATPTDDLDRVVTRDASALVLVDSEVDLPGFFDSFGRGVSVLALFAQVLLIAIGALLPFALVLAGIALIVRWGQRRRPAAAHADQPAGGEDDVEK
ncbi:MAG: DUF4349 domain-containing protein [Actinomycetota bacterium]